MRRSRTSWRTIGSMAAFGGIAEGNSLPKMPRMASYYRLSAVFEVKEATADESGSGGHYSLKRRFCDWRIFRRLIQRLLHLESRRVLGKRHGIDVQTIDEDYSHSARLLASAVGGEPALEPLSRVRHSEFLILEFFAVQSQLDSYALFTVSSVTITWFVKHSLQFNAEAQGDAPPDRCHSRPG